MQAWDQVKVKAPGAFEGQAGVILRYDAKTEIATVKLDSDPTAPKEFAAVELERLG
jgi:transcription antitermination factor NusG